MEKPLIVIAGPTAVGKSDQAIELAKKIDGEIISADSMQVYKYMDIGTAKVTIEERQAVKHYLIDELLPDEEYSVAVFQKMAKSYIQEIYDKKKIPILVGGTGFYINALLYDTEFSRGKSDLSYRKELADITEDKGVEYLHRMLKAVDVCSYEAIHQNDVKRVMRALEYYHQTGEAISKHNEEEKSKKCGYDAKIFILTADRPQLYKRIDKRVDMMIEKGLIDEVNSLLNRGYGRELVSMQGIGYKQIAAFLAGEYSLDTAIELLKRDTRRFAKRQLTWFSRQLEGQWLNAFQDSIIERSESFYDKQKL